MGSGCSSHKEAVQTGTVLWQQVEREVPQAPVLGAVMPRGAVHSLGEGTRGPGVLDSTQESRLQKEHLPSNPASVRAASVVGQGESRSLIESKCWVSSCTEVFLQKDLVGTCPEMC